MSNERPALTATSTLDAPHAWNRHHLLDLDEFSAAEIETVMETTDAMKEVMGREVPRVPALRGRTIITLFYEASTRTRASFELAGKSLGADVINVAAGGSSIEKGESLIDTVRTLQAVGADVLVMRHGSSGAPYLVARQVSCSVVNGGDGWHAHPTQALLDLYTMRTHLGAVRGKRVVIVGDIAHSRVARSDIWGLTAMGAEVVVCAPPTLLPAGMRAVGANGVRPIPSDSHEPLALPHVDVETDLDRAIEGADVVMTLRLQKERMTTGLLPSLREYATLYQVNEERLSRAKTGALVMHPGPMNEGVEISPAVAHSLQSVIEEQVTNGVAVRMAVLYLLAKGEGMTTLAIRGGRVIDPANGIDTVADILIEDGRIVAVGKDTAKNAAEAIDASGLVVCPGFVDIHTHLREPGFEHKETIATGTLAAARGGFTTVCAMPNTQPPIDSAAAVEQVLRTAETQGHVRVLPIACVTKGRAGHDLAELAELAKAGAIAFSDDGSPVADSHLMRRALEYAGMLGPSTSLRTGVPIIDHCEDPALATGGVMHEGWVSTRLGLRGVPAAAEETMVARNIALAQETGSHVHLAHISTAGSVELVRQAKARGVPVTAEVTPHHLALTHEAVLLGPGETPGGLAYDTNAKVNPPLRTQADADACIAGLIDGTIDCIATDHAPHAIQDKLCEFDTAAFGISGLETAFSLSLTVVPLETLIERLTIAPVRALGLDRRLPGLGTLSTGAPADVALIDPQGEWTVVPETFASKGKNTPLAGRTLRGRIVATAYGGQAVWQR